MHSYDDLSRRWKALRSRGDLSVREVACVGVPRTILCVEAGDLELPTIALAAGTHGDEPAPPWALLESVEARELDAHYAYRMWPCINPSGYRAGTRENAEGTDVNRSFGRGGTTPEARAIVTANRDRKFVLSIDLHEDCDAEGFYTYEYGATPCARAAIAAVRAHGYPVQDLDRCDLGAPFSGAEIDDGVVHPMQGSERAIGGISYSMALARRAAARALTFETPRALRFEERIALHRIAVKAAIGALSKG
jgi:protein MpaA